MAGGHDSGPYWGPILLYAVFLWLKADKHVGDPSGYQGSWSNSLASYSTLGMGEEEKNVPGQKRPLSQCFDVLVGNYTGKTGN